MGKSMPIAGVYSMLSAIIGYAMAYSHAVALVFVRACLLTWEFATTRLDLTVAAAAVILLAEARGIWPRDRGRRKLVVCGEKLAKLSQ
jgi:hypothetical protein